MYILYKINGIKAVGNRICLTIIPVEEKKDFDTGKVLRNLGGFMENMKSQAVISRNPDQVSVTVDEYKDKGYTLGDVISVSINKG